MPEANGMITQHYFSYLVRIWQGEGILPGGWHASLEDPSTQRMLHFNTLEELFEYFRLIAGKDQGSKIHKYLMEDDDEKTDA